MDFRPLDHMRQVSDEVQPLSQDPTHSVIQQPEPRHLFIEQMRTYHPQHAKCTSQMWLELNIINKLSNRQKSQVITQVETRCCCMIEHTKHDREAVYMRLRPMAY